MATTTPKVISQDELMNQLAGKTIAPKSVPLNANVNEVQAPGLPIGNAKVNPVVAPVTTSAPASKVTTAPTVPVLAPVTAPTTTTGGTSIYTGGSAVPDGKPAIGYRDAQGNTKYFRDTTTAPTTNTNSTTNTEVTTEPRKSALQYQDDAYKSIYPEYAGAIDAITQNYTSLINEARQTGVKNQGANRAQGAAFGLIGSPNQTTNAGNISKATDSAVGKLNTARAMEISSVIEKIHNNAASLAKEQARMDQQGVADTLAARDKAKAESQDHIVAFASQGITASDLKEKSPETYQNLIDQSGLDDNTLAAMFTLKTPANNVINKQVVGSTYYQTVQAPDGTVKTQNFDLGFTPPIDYSMNVDEKNGTIVWYPKQPDPNKDISSQIIVKKYGVASGDGTGTGTGVGGAYVVGSNPTVDAWASRINSGQAKLSDITGVKNTALKNEVVRALNTMSGGKLSAVQDNLREAKLLVQELIDHPGRSATTGAPSVFTNPAGLSLPASDARDFKAKVTRLNSLLFLNAIPQMRGMGQLTEREGAKLESSSSVTNELGMPEEAYLNELKRLQTKLKDSLENIGGNVKQAPSTPPAAEHTPENGGGIVEYPIGSGKMYKVEANGDMTPA